MPEIKIDPQSNVLTLGTMEFEAHFDRMIILQDDFRSGYECSLCMTKGEIECENCRGSGKSVVVKDGKCSACNGSGKQICPECKGKGATIIVPQNAERRPTTGTIVSVGERVTTYKRGDSVIYPSFVGHAYDMAALDMQGHEVAATIVIMREEEALCAVRGHLELRQIKRSAALGTAA